MTRAALLILLLSTTAAIACDKKGTNEPQEDKKDLQAREKVTERATYDMQCDVAQLDVQKISDEHEMMGMKNTTWGVRGCDKQVTYKVTCGMGNCQVMTDAELKATGMSQ